MMATVRHVTSSSGLTKFQADGFLFDCVYKEAVFRKLKRGPQEMWSVLRPENVRAVSCSLVGECSCSHMS